MVIRSLLGLNHELLLTQGSSSKHLSVRYEAYWCPLLTFSLPHCLETPSWQHHILIQRWKALFNFHLFPVTSALCHGLWYSLFASLNLCLLYLQSIRHSLLFSSCSLGSKKRNSLESYGEALWLISSIHYASICLHLSPKLPINQTLIHQLRNQSTFSSVYMKKLGKERTLLLAFILNVEGYYCLFYFLRS